MAVSTRSVADALGAIVGAGAVKSGEAGRPVDGVVPRWVVEPAATEELGSVLGLAHAEKLVVVPRGSGSAMALGHPLTHADLVVDLGRMDGILEYNPDDLTMTVGAGATLGSLEARLRACGQFLPLDPPGAATRTIGGLVATNASGPLRVRYGTSRDLLLGIRFVQADGVVTWGGAKVVKSVTGYDVPKLMVGALGTLGILAELTLRLHPLPACERTWIVGLGAAERAQAFVASLIDSSLQPNRVEWLNAVAARTWTQTPTTAAILISVGSVEAAVRAQQAQMEGLARQAGGVMREVAHEGWLGYGARRDSAGAVTLRVGTLASALANTITGLEGALADIAPAAALAVTGSAVVGALRAELLRASPAEASAFVSRARTLVEPVSGSVIIEQAPIAVRRAVDPWGPVAPEPFALMRAIKREFDPEGILNPGRFVGGL
ncbi:MAG: FAD-binding oxidoreductase [Candidatus Rokuibacteriota bacterium]